jgi:hypothetical protein
MNNAEVVYTPWANLNKSPSMDVGQVGFDNPRMVSIHSYYDHYANSLIACLSSVKFIIHFILRTHYSKKLFFPRLVTLH